MADVDITPKIRCDNCGTIEEKVIDGIGPRKFRRPRSWGSMKAEGGSVRPDTYGAGKERLDFPDLCQACADGALGAASAFLKVQRGEKLTRGTVQTLYDDGGA